MVETVQFDARTGSNYWLHQLVRLLVVGFNAKPLGALLGGPIMVDIADDPMQNGYPSSNASSLSEVNGSL